MRGYDYGGRSRPYERVTTHRDQRLLGFTGREPGRNRERDRKNNRTGLWPSGLVL